MKVTVMDGQSVLDVAVQCCGGLEAAMAIAVANGIGLTDRLADGQVLNVAESAAGVDRRTVAIYRAHGIVPATAASDGDVEACPYGGIGLMGIEIDFGVS